MLAYFSLLLPSMLRYLLPASPDRGPVGWMVRLLVATTSPPANVGLAIKLARNKPITGIERFRIVARLGGGLGSRPGPSYQDPRPCSESTANQTWNLPSAACRPQPNRRL